jgi:serine/threonine protein kinase
VSDHDLLRPIGEGAFGRVWLARNRTTGQLRAVKVIPLHRSGVADRAGREITSVTRLEKHVRRQHPNLLHVHHVGKTADHLFYIMDLADDASGAPGSSAPGYRPATLRSRLELGPLPPDECFRCARRLLAALAFLHEAGVVHRDVKPENCLFVDGELKLGDFGLLAEADPQVSRVGTPKYMPPDGHMGPRADVYAAGLVIYEMMTGLPAENFPRPGEDARHAVDNTTLGVLNRLTLRACHPDPQRRFRDCREMSEALKPLRAVTSQVDWRRHIIAAIAGVAVALCAAAAIFWATLPEQVHVHFVTHPFEAAVYLDDELQVDAKGEPVRTPCTIEGLAPRSHHVVFEREGFPRLDAGRRNFARERRIEEQWD